MIQDKKQDTSTLQKKLTFWSADCHHQEIAPYLSLGITPLLYTTTPIWLTLQTPPSYLLFYIFENITPMKMEIKTKWTQEGKLFLHILPLFYKKILSCPILWFFKNFNPAAIHDKGLILWIDIERWIIGVLHKVPFISKK